MDWATLNERIGGRYKRRVRGGGWVGDGGGGGWGYGEAEAATTGGTTSAWLRRSLGNYWKLSSPEY